ncbi:hypothetical protein FH972_021598 [Carpinus fangiana]|uniref:Uncharacterized protein n=1 Tax=Carpinus fangiana TaxID=176857 RepID=A0A5N6KRX7_9ROSI|nr:hypothetical protein FH972_021598 [Carpinus fangiana]
MAPVSPVPKRPVSHPKPRLRLHNNSLEDEGSVLFVSTFHSPRELLVSAIEEVLATLYPSWYSKPHLSESTSATDDADSPVAPWPEVRSITLVIDDGYDGVAYTSGIPIDDSHKEIHLSTTYVHHQQPSGRLQEEIYGVIVHEMVHCWQHSCDGIPGGLIEGVADFVRLKAGLSPPHWKKEHSGKWDGGYQHTAYFLEWLESKYGAGSVEKLNAHIGQIRQKAHTYDEKRFWEGLFGREVGGLWKDYGESLKN